MKTEMKYLYRACSNDHPGTGTTPLSSATSSNRYTCSMHPEIVHDAPGNCPKCGMTLIPI